MSPYMKAQQAAHLPIPEAPRGDGISSELRPSSLCLPLLWNDLAPLLAKGSAASWLGRDPRTGPKPPDAAAKPDSLREKYSQAQPSPRKSCQYLHPDKSVSKQTQYYGKVHQPCRSLNDGMRGLGPPGSPTGRAYGGAPRPGPGARR